MSRALIITNEYSKIPQYRLYGCINDGLNIITRLQKIDPTIKIVHMRDDLAFSHPLFPNKINIMRELNTLISSSEKKLFFHYSGHGTSIADTNADELEILKSNFGSDVSKLNGLGRDSCIVCYDNNKIGLLVDDDIYNILKNLDSSKVLYGFSDSCNSGTLFDLGYVNVGDYTTPFTTSDIKQLCSQINKCTIASSFYSSKVNKIKGNIIFFSGTRDSKYSYEVYMNKQPCGLFTYNLCRLLDYGISSMTIKDFYFLLIASINYLGQIPVLSFSNNLVLTTFKMSDLLYKPIVPVSKPKVIFKKKTLLRIINNKNKKRNNKKRKN